MVNLSRHSINVKRQGYVMLGATNCMIYIIIDFAQEILKKLFPSIYGLESTLLITRSSKLPKLPEFTLPTDCNGLQFQHLGLHWRFKFMIQFMIILIKKLKNFA